MARVAQAGHGASLKTAVSVRFKDGRLVPFITLRLGSDVNGLIEALSNCEDLAA